jgi:cell division protein ZapA
VGRVTLEVNGKPYVIGCEDGGEAHLEALVARIDSKVRQVAPEAGAPGDTRLMLMAALMIADDLLNVEQRVAAVEAQSTDLKKALGDLEFRVVAALDAAADRLEQMAPDPEAGQLLLL